MPKKKRTKLKRGRKRYGMAVISLCDWALSALYMLCLYYLMTERGQAELNDFFILSDGGFLWTNWTVDLWCDSVWVKLKPTKREKGNRWMGYVWVGYWHTKHGRVSSLLFSSSSSRPLYNFHSPVYYWHFFGLNIWCDCWSYRLFLFCWPGRPEANLDLIYIFCSVLKQANSSPFFSSPLLPSIYTNFFDIYFFDTVPRRRYHVYFPLSVFFLIFSWFIFGYIVRSGLYIYHLSYDRDSYIWFCLSWSDSTRGSNWFLDWW